MNPLERYWHDHAGFNFRMTNMQAAIGVAQMGRIDELIDRRRLILRRYDSILSHCPNISLLPKNDWSENSCWLYTIILTDYDSSVRDRLITQLAHRGIDARPVFYPMHQMAPYSDFSRGEYSVSCRLSEKSISLPSSFGLTGDDIQHIADTFLDELGKFERDSIDAT